MGVGFRQRGIGQQRLEGEDVGFAVDAAELAFMDAGGVMVGTDRRLTKKSTTFFARHRFGCCAIFAFNWARAAV